MGKTSFSDGNPSTGVLGTIITAAFLNALNVHRHMGTDVDGDGALDYAETTGSANAYFLSFSQALPAYVTGMPFFFMANHTNTGAATMNINSLGEKSLKKNVSDDVEAGDIVSGKLYMGMYDGTNIVIINIPKTSLKTSSYPDNYSLAASIASYALTVTRKGDGGDDLSSSNIAIVPFRNPTLTLGTIHRQQYTANASITIPQGATLGAATGESIRFYIYEGTDGTSTDIGVIRKAIVPEDGLYSSTAMSTGATSDTTLYSTAGRTSWVWKCVGYIEATMGATIGNWSSIDKVQIMAPGIHRSGDPVGPAVQVIKTDTFSTASTSYVDITDLSLVVPVSSALNKVRFDIRLNGASINTVGSVQMMRGSTPINIGAAASSRIQATVAGFVANGQDIYNLAAEILDAPGAAGSITYKTQARVQSTGTFVLNKSTTDTDSEAYSRTSSTITAQEVFA